jgi:peptidyl-prolyl cis-trans isomerase B (cyclophilin B)
MIQAGDPNSVNAPEGQMLGRGGPGYTIPAEFYPHLIHKKGALAAARMPDKMNPNKESSGSQFYIVQGQTYTDEQLDMMEKNNSRIKFTEEDRNIYKTIGGTPHLDYNYTVFGELIDGFDVLDAIAKVPVDKNNRPLEDVVIKTITISK